jgi:hypothetical protein
MECQPDKNAYSHFFLIFGVELEIPTRLAPRKNIVNGSDTEDDARIIKKRITVNILINNLYIFTSCVTIPDTSEVSPFY